MAQVIVLNPLQRARVHGTIRTLDKRVLILQESRLGDRRMKECTIEGCNSVELVYSGADAFYLGVQTEVICYDHANKQLLERVK